MNSQVILRRVYALAIALVLSLLIGSKTVYSQSVTFTPNGVWLPSMTSNERITMPVTMGQLVFDTNTKSIWYHTGVGGDWKELITVKPSADNLGNHTATQNINVGDYFLSPDGLDRGLKVGREQLLLQLSKPRFQLGTNLATNSQINFANYSRNWAISTSQDRFEIVDSTFQTRPFIIEKNAFHNMLYIQEDKVGIGTSSPREKLEVAGKIKMNGFQLHNGTNTSGFILQSDAGGNGTWVNPAAAGFNYWTVANGAMFPNQNVNVGIGTEAPSSKLEVNGKLKATEVEIASTLKTASIETSGTTKTTNFQLTNGAINGYILQSDANGNASWKSPASLPISFSESDPKVGSLSRNTLPKWNGNKLTDGTMVDNGNIGIGVTSPTNKLEVAGTTKTTNLQLTNGATNGYILQSDASGNALWKDPSSLPISFNETDPKVGTLTNNVLPKWNGTKLTDGTMVDNGNIGIGVASPTNKLEVAGTTKTTNLQLTNGATNGYILQSDANGNALWKDPSSLPISFNETDPKVGALSTNALPKWNGTKLTDGTMVDNGNIGIGVTSPTNKLEVAGTTKTTNFQLTNGATNGYILQSDANGNALWKDPSSLPITFSETDPKVGALTANALPKWNGTKLTDGTMVDNGNIGIGVASPTNKLEVAGTTKTTNFQLTNGATNGYILQSDANGNAVWKNPTSLGITFTETDPKVGSQSMDYVPTWDGTKLVKGGIFDNRQGKIGILNDDPRAPLSVGKSYITNLDAITYFNTSENKPVVIASVDNATPDNNKGIMIGEQGNEIQGRSGNSLATNGDLILNAYDGNVGIGTTTPNSKLDVEGKIKSTDFQLTNGATDGYILQSDASGNAVWIDPSSLPISFNEADPKVGNQLTYFVPTWNGTQLVKGGIYSDVYGNVGILNSDPKAPFSVGESYTTNLNAITYINTAGNKPVVIANIDKAIPANNKGLLLGERGNEIQGRAGNSLITNSDLILNPYSGNVGVGTSSPTAKLDVNGNAKAKSIQLSDGAQNGYILQSDASGNASWVSPNFTESDPKIGSLTSNFLPKWNGSTLANTQIFDNGTNVGIGTNTPSTKLDINGKAKASQLQLTTGATNNYVLKSDASGNASWADPSHLTTILQDADGNTKIEVEKAANEDVIHFSTNGKERFAIKGAQMAVYSTGGSTFLGYAAGENDDLTNNLNTYVGYFSGNKTTTGIGNVALGSLALENNVSGIYNIAIGSQSLNQTTTSSNNTAVGVFAGQNATGSGNIFIGYGAGKNETGNNKLYIDNSNTSTPLVYGDFSSNELSVNGKLGIGTTTPTQAKLVVNGNASNTLSYAYLNGSNQTGTVTNYTANYSIYASDRVAAVEFNAFSDARIKDIKGKSNNVQDLETLSKIEITDYQFKDKIEKGNGHHKKVIAQQVETVYPQAVSKTTDVIPDIYRLANIQNNFVELSNHQLTVGEKVKLIFGEKQEVFEVEAVNEKGFKIKNNGTSLLAVTSVFVYGREVSDFRSVDYEALSTLNISATQALLKRIEQLESENTIYKNEFKSFRAELEQLKAAVTGVNETKGK
ncbi:tail fiber domain-containing protein [Runella sp. SP2]|uniref:tail fiber domain-containing protein n=1 Tax=Runella sp. SP2 TaxID=2268026 RepID=UPI000F08918C|nr:tail fiber domain-containing protein [Runella sp. SP2]AYQ31476.1 tail fiber domain-containing protein [Runella sp. SP2]